jgi:hypothetical protein
MRNDVNTLQRSRLRLYSTSVKVADSILNTVIRFFNLFNPSSHIVVVGLTQTNRNRYEAGA